MITHLVKETRKQKERRGWLRSETVKTALKRKFIADRLYRGHLFGVRNESFGLEKLSRQGKKNKKIDKLKELKK